MVCSSWLEKKCLKVNCPYRHPGGREKRTGKGQPELLWPHFRGRFATRKHLNTWAASFQGSRLEGDDLPLGSIWILQGRPHFRGPD